MKGVATYTDSELIALMRQGEHAAFEEIYNRYYNLLLNFAIRRHGELTEVEDALQDVFLNLWTYHSEFTLKTSLLSYLIRATTNRIINLARNKKVKDRYVESLASYLKVSAESADNRIRESMMQELIAREIDALPPRMKSVFLLRQTRYLSNRQIAEELDISEQTVETHMKKALKVLRGRLGLNIFLLHIFY